MYTHGLCFDVGSSGKCCGNCYKCADKYGDKPITDEEIAIRLGKCEQERMLAEYEGN